jgi:hypothetical protein
MMKQKLRTMTCALWALLLMPGAVMLSGTPATAAETDGELEATRREVRELKNTVGDLVAEVERLKESDDEKPSLEGLDAALGKLKFGGYGEMHANFSQGSEKDQFDIHRLVLYLGYDFADWIIFNSETELEHAYVNDGDGEVSLVALSTRSMSLRRSTVWSVQPLPPTSSRQRGHPTVSVYSAVLPRH